MFHIHITSSIFCRCMYIYAYVYIYTYILGCGFKSLLLVNMAPLYELEINSSS